MCSVKKGNMFDVLWHTFSSAIDYFAGYWLMKIKSSEYLLIGMNQIIVGSLSISMWSYVPVSCFTMGVVSNWLSLVIIEHIFWCPFQLVSFIGVKKTRIIKENERSPLYRCYKVLSEIMLVHVDETTTPMRRWMFECECVFRGRGETY